MRVCFQSRSSDLGDLELTAGRPRPSVVVVLRTVGSPVSGQAGDSDANLSLNWVVTVGGLLASPQSLQLKGWALVGLSHMYHQEG